MTDSTAAPERSLIAAVICRSIIDYKQNRPQHKPIAYAWMFEDTDNQDLWSFNWCCEAIDVCPNRLRNTIKNVINDLGDIRNASHRNHVQALFMNDNEPVLHYRG